MIANYTIHVNREQATDKSIIFDYGVCAADINNPSSKPLEFKQGIEQILQKGTDDGTIQINDKYDDRKYRMNDPIIDSKGKKIIMPLGVTYWDAYKTDMERTDENVGRLRKMGIKYHNDPLAFFARALSFEVLPIFQDGYVAIGSRINEILKGKLNAVGGFVNYKGDARQLDMSEEVYRELNEELGFQERDLNYSPQLVGVVSDLRGDTGVLYLQRVNLSHDYIKSGAWIKRAKTREHGEFTFFNNMNDISDMLRLNQKSLLFLTEQLLRSLRHEDLKVE